MYSTCLSLILILFICCYCCNNNSVYEYHLYQKPINQLYLFKESYNDYLIKAKEMSGHDCEWIYDLIDGKVNDKNNNNKIYYSNHEMIIITPHDWNGDDTKGLHLLAFPKNKNLRSMRDLTGKDIPLLEEMNKITKKIIKHRFNIESDMIKSYVHYYPNVWLLHIHFVLLNDTVYNHSFEYSYSLDSIINNLKVNSDYYKIINLEVSVPSNHINKN